jgi:hypothetical protein
MAAAAGVHKGLGARKRRALVPARDLGERALRADCLVLALGGYGDEAPIAHDPDDAGHAGDSCGVERAQPRAIARRAHDPRMHHSR